MTDMYVKPPIEEGEEIIERDEAAARRSDSFRNADCLGWVAGFGWYDNTSGKWVSERPLDKYKVSNAIKMFGPGALLFWVANPVPEDPTKPKRRCRIASMIGSDVVSLIKLSPNNATFRARVMAVLGEMPPKDCITFDQIKDWVEFNFPKEKKIEPKKPNETFAIQYRGDERERGKCTFTRRRVVRGNYTFSQNEIEEIMASCDGIDDLYARMDDRLRDHANEQGDSDYNSEETDNHDLDDSDGLDMEYPHRELRVWAAKIARAHFGEDAEALQDFGLE